MVESFELLHRLLRVQVQRRDAAGLRELAVADSAVAGVGRGRESALRSVKRVARDRHPACRQREATRRNPGSVELGLSFFSLELLLEEADQVEPKVAESMREHLLLEQTQKVSLSLVLLLEVPELNLLVVHLGCLVV